jgi:hypothetical protein
MNKTLISVFLLSFFSLSLYAEIVSKDNITADNLYLFGGSMKEYIAPSVTYSDAPKGYSPFYMSHYGRHGSRYLLNTPQYEGPYNILKEANDKGVLSEFGKSVMNRLEIMKNDADGRLGDLTAKGKKQHREIAYRMVKNFPTIFNKKAIITARSTTSHRVMASMTSALMEFARLLPKMTIDYDDSGYDVYYMNTEDRFINSAKNSMERNAAVSQFNARHTHPQRLMAALFSDTTFITQYQMQIPVSMRAAQGSIQQPRMISAAVVDRSESLYNQIYEVAANMQSHDLGFNLDDVFTYDEWYDNFTMNNIYWYSVSAFSPLTDEIVPYGHATLLQDILDKANASIKDGSTNANLRYGHDTALFPLLCLMEINDCEWSVSDLEKVADKWVDYDIVHMGSNLQLVFYKSKKGPVLVKALLNEKEANLPVESYRDSKGKVFEHYYEWEKVNKYYQDKLNVFYAKRSETEQGN